MSLHLRPLAPGELLDRCFSIYRKNFLLFVGVSVVWPGLVLAVNVVADLLIKPGTALTSETIFAWIVVGVKVVVWCLGWVVTQAATIRAISAIYLEESISIRDAYKDLQLGRVLRTALLVGSIVIVFLVIFSAVMMAIMLGLGYLLDSIRMDRSNAGRIFILVSYVAMLCGTLVLWVRVSARYLIAIPVSALEKKGAFASVRRSARLLKGGNTRASTLVIVMFVFALGGWFEIVGPAMLIGNVTEWLGIIGNLLLEQITSFCATALLSPINTIWVALLYYDQCIRKEAFDIEFLMREASGAATELAASAAGTG